MTKQQISEDLKKSMLARDELRTSTLRMLISAIGYYEIEKGGAGYKATDEDVMAVIQKQAKQRQDSIEQFKNAGRQELVDKETKELEIVQTYMPAQMGEDEVKKLVDDAVAKSGAASIQDIGKVMGILMPQVKGKADGRLVSKLVKEKLSPNL